MREYGNEKLTPEETAANTMAPITSALNKHNITIDRLANKLDKLIDCKRGEEEDSSNQIKAVDMGLKLTQSYPTEKADVTLHIEDIISKLAEKREGKGTGD